MKQDTLFCLSFIFYTTVLFSNARGPNGPHFCWFFTNKTFCKEVKSFLLALSVINAHFRCIFITVDYSDVTNRLIDFPLNLAISQSLATQITIISIFRPTSFEYIYTSFADFPPTHGFAALKKRFLKCYCSRLRVCSPKFEHETQIWFVAFRQYGSRNITCHSIVSNQNKI